MNKIGVGCVASQVGESFSEKVTFDLSSTKKLVITSNWRLKARTSLVVQTVKHLSTMWETQVPSLCWEDPLKKEMAIHSRTTAWKIPWTEEPGRLQSMGSQRVGHDWATSLFPFVHWRRKWQPTPVFLPRESQGQGSLVGCRLWGCTESDTTEVT